jgi:hypothetical protein
MEVSGQLHAPAALSPREGAPGTHCIGGWVGPRAVLDAVVKRKIPSPRWESNRRTPIVQPVAQRYTDWAITAPLHDCTGLKFYFQYPFVVRFVKKKKLMKPNMTRLLAGRRRFDSWQGQGFIFSSLCPQRLWSPPSLLSNRYRGLFCWGVKQLGREADHSSPSSAEVKNAWSYTSTPQYAFMAWCSVKAQGQLYLYLLPIFVRAEIVQSVKRLATGWMIGVRFPVRAGNFSLRHHIQTGTGTHPASYPIGTGGFFPWG